MGMTRDESAMVGLEIVAYAGDARSKLMLALEAAQNGQLRGAQVLIEEANTLITMAHKTQTRMLQEEAAGEHNDIGFVMIHGQDHLMNTMLLRDLMKHFIALYQKVHNKEA